MIIDAQGNVGLFQTYTLGGGFGLNQGSGLFVAASNAFGIDNYKAYSTDVSGGGGAVFGGSLDYSTFSSGGGPNGQSTFNEFGFTVGEDTGASLQATRSYTTVTPLFNVYDVASKAIQNAAPFLQGNPSYGYPGF